MKVILLGLCISIYHGLAGQVSINNHSLTDSSLNILYIGIGNQIQIKTADNPRSYRLTVKGAETTLTATDTAHYTLRVYSTDTCILTVSKNGRPVLYKKYVPVPLTEGHATLNGTYNAPMSISKILINPFLKIVFPNSYYKHDYRIIRFSAKFLLDSDSMFVQLPGTRLDTKSLALIRQLSPGDTLYFYDIVVGCSSGRNTQAPPFWIKLE